jgi:hypothetical protein
LILNGTKVTILNELPLAKTMCFNMAKIKGFCILVLFSYSCFAQDILSYEIKATSIKLGEVRGIQTTFGNNDSISYRLESTLKALSFYKINYFAEAVFANSKLKRSLVYVNVNGNNYHYCSAVLKNSVYVIKTPNNEIIHYNKPITSSLIPYYFTNYRGHDSVFSEYSGKYQPFVKKVGSIYIFHPDDPMEFEFKNGHINKVTIPNSILNFQIEFKAD